MLGSSCGLSDLQRREEVDYKTPENRTITKNVLLSLLAKYPENYLSMEFIDV